MSLFLDPKLRETWVFFGRFCSFPIFQAERDGHSYGKAHLGLGLGQRPSNHRRWVQGKGDSLNPDNRWKSFVL